MVDGSEGKAAADTSVLSVPAAERQGLEADHHAVPEQVDQRNCAGQCAQDLKRLLLHGSSLAE